jgi:hypothetical protein
MGQTSKSDNALIVMLNTNDTRNPVIVQWLDTVGDGMISATVRDVLYRYITGLIQPVGPNQSFEFNLTGTRAGIAPYEITWTFNGATEDIARERALEFARDNYPDFKWYITPRNK